MQIDSTKVHEALNQIAIQAHEFTIRSAVDAVKEIRRALCDLEAQTACERSSVNFSGALEGMKDR